MSRRAGESPEHPAFATANHPVMAAIDAVANSKTFVATVVSVEREDSSTRGIVTLHTGDNRDDEQVRTDRTDDALGLATARLAWSLIGRKVLVFVEVVPFANGTRKMRTLRHLVPLDAP